MVNLLALELARPGLSSFEQPANPASNPKLIHVRSNHFFIFLFFQPLLEIRVEQGVHSRLVHIVGRGHR